jgi:lactate racemase
MAAELTARSRSIELDTGREILKLRIPSGVRLELLRTYRPSLAPDPLVELKRALANPVGSPPLERLAKPGYRVALLVCDNTRHAPQKLAIPLIMASLIQAGVRKQDITIIIACGTHAPMSAEAIEAMLGPVIPREYRVINHDAENDAGLCNMGHSKELGIPIVLNHIAAKADLRIGLGPVDPHLFAGWSGGSKILSVGVAGKATIAGTHNPRVMEDPGTRYGVIEGNTFRRFLDEAAGVVPLDFILNVVQDSDKGLVQAFAGHARQAWIQAVALARTIYEVDAEEQADIVLSVPTWPKSINLYQAIRAANPAVFGRPPLLRDGGTLIIPARCPDGIGSSQFEEDMVKAISAADIIERGRRDGFDPEGNKSFTVAKVLSHCHVTLCDTDLPRDRLNGMKLGWAKDLTTALESALESEKKKTSSHPDRSEPRLTILPDGFSILPRLPETIMQGEQP